MTELQIHCFGNLQVNLDRQPIDHFDTNKSRALLVYLAIENTQPQHRSHLAGLLWSDQPEEQAQHSLRQTLSNLRRTLGDANSLSPILLIERETVSLNPNNTIWVDVHAFQSGLASAYRHYQRRDQGGWINVRRLTAALALRNGAFLAHFQLKGGLLFDEWQTLMREEFDQQALQGMAQLSEIYEKRGEYTLAQQMAHRMIDIAPWDEQAHLQLMRLFALDGQKSVAQNQYRILKHFLQEHLNVEPADETKALFEQIRSRKIEQTSVFLRFSPGHSNLPKFSSPFIGREQEMEEITDLLVDPACRLLTLLGTGGVGKTRLALEIAQQQFGLLSEGVFFIPLSSVSTAEKVSAAVSDAIGLVLTDQSDPHTRLLDYLREKRMLLVLDNCEQLLGDPKNIHPFIDILDCAPGVTLLVTSRERLMLQEEWIYPLTGMRYPLSQQPDKIYTIPEWVERYDALSLFYQRAQQVQFGFPEDSSSLPNVIRICQMLEGLPLGLELAAAALWKHPCSTIAEKIGQHLNAFTASAVNIQPRHRNLWAAFEVSWQLLTREEQTLLRWLSVFQGGFTLEAAHEVVNTTADLLSDLVNKSLLRCNLDGRYVMHEAVRQFANEKLTEAGCVNEARSAHASYYIAFLASQDAALHNHKQKEALSVIHEEIGNAEIAWDWLTHQRNFEAIISCVDPLFQYFNIRSRFNEGIALLQSSIPVLAKAATTGSNPAAEVALGMTMSRVGSLEYYARQNTLAYETLEHAAKLFERLELASELAVCRMTLGGVYLRAKEFNEALVCGQQNLEYYRNVKDILGENRALYLLGLVNNRLGKFEESKQFLLTAVNVERRGTDPRKLIAPLNLLGDIACRDGNYKEAETLFRQSLEIARDLQDLFYQAIVLNNLATVYHYEHQFEKAREIYGESLAICKEIGDRDGEAFALNNLGELALIEGEYGKAMTYSIQALEIARQIGEEWTIIICLNNLGETSNALNKPEQAMNYLTEAICLAWDIESIDSVARFAVNVGRSFQLLGRLKDAIEIYRGALAHSATEYDAREKAISLLKELGQDPQIENDDHILEDIISRIFLSQKGIKYSKP
ncbi:MAG: hypothetical protein CVU39_16470 [Chloroflexi bacterium HGW-Chloroflexi-10]|nr:MAG: hypothetical protein CVU39_16470 [Chloroflexi bacterium HGW-Chloroflexi-10]